MIKVVIGLDILNSLMQSLRAAIPGFVLRLIMLTTIEYWFPERDSLTQVV